MPFFLSDNSIWGQRTEMLQMLMLLSLRKNGLTSLFKEVRGFQGFWPAKEFAIATSVAQSGALRFESATLQTEMPSWVAKRPAPYRSLLGPSGPECPGSVPESVPEDGSVQGSVPQGVPGTLRVPGSGVSKKCPESVPRVSRTPFAYSGDNLGTLRSPGLEGAPETPRGTLPWTPPFSGTLSGTLPGTLRARRAQETLVGGRALRKSWVLTSELC